MRGSPIFSQVAKRPPWFSSRVPKTLGPEERPEGRRLRLRGGDRRAGEVFDPGRPAGGHGVRGLLQPLGWAKRFFLLLLLFMYF